MKNINILQLFESIDFDHSRYSPKFRDIGDVTAIRYKKGKPFRRNFDRALLVYAIANTFKTKTFLEFGTGRGYVTSCVSLCPHVERVVTIDIDPAAKKIVKSLGLPTFDKIDFIIGKSQKLSRKDLPKSVDLAFIDGEHSHDAVKNDFELIKDIAPIVIFDDFRNKHKGVKRYIKSIADEREKIIVSTDGWIYKNSMIKRHGDADKIVDGKEMASGQVLLINKDLINV